MPRLPIDLIEATRLTRAGRLTEALAMLQKGLVPPKSAQGSTGGEGAGPVQEPPAGLSAAAGAPKMPAGLRSMFDRLARREARRTDGPTQVPAGARFEARSYANAAGARAYKLYVPSRYAAGEPLPLIVMLHGCTQTPDDFAAGTRMNELAEAGPFLVAYPAQTKAANASRCWNWFNAAEQRRDGTEASLIAGITREIMAEFDVDPRCVYIAGLSAGGAAAAIMGATYPDLYAAVGVHSGLACGAARDMPSAFAAMRGGGAGRAGPDARLPPTIVFHGDGDTTVHPINGDRVIERARPNGADLASSVTQGRSEGGMAYTRTVQRGRHGIVSELWVVHGAGHAWAGGSPDGSYTDARGPDASREMVRFFRQASASPVRPAV